MPYATIRGVQINYQVVGTEGPWVALSPGGRRPMAIVASLAERMAKAGYRVVIHDRRNCGASDVSMEGEDSEYEIWADDLHELLGQLGALPAIIGGSSSGCRLSVLFALRHPEAVRALLLWRVTGGTFAGDRLAQNYYGEYIDLAHTGGMAAVCDSEHFAQCIADRPENRDRLMAMDVDAFVKVMSHWRDYFLAGKDLPIIGASEADLGSISVPTVVVPGNDWTHGLETGRTAHRLIPGSEYFEIFTEMVEADLYPLEEWDAREEDLANGFLDFLKRRLQAA